MHRNAKTAPNGAFSGLISSRQTAGRISGGTTGWKKAIVTLEPGEHIDLFEQV